MTVADKPERPFIDAFGKPIISKLHINTQSIDRVVIRDEEGLICIFQL